MTTYDTNKPIILLVAGPSGIGKSWVCKQLIDKITYVGYDEVKRSIFDDKILHAATKDGIVLIDMPIKVSTFIKRNEHLYNIMPAFIEEDENIHRDRLESRGGKWKDSIISRRDALKRRAKKYAHFVGTSAQVLHWLEERIEIYEREAAKET